MPARKYGGIMRKTTKNHVTNEQHLKKLIKETLENDIAQNQGFNSEMNSQVSQAHFEQLWAQAEHNSFQRSKVIQSKSVQAPSIFSSLLSSRPFTFSLMIGAFLFILFGTPTLFTPDEDKVIKSIEIAQTSSYMMDSSDEEDYLSWLDHDDWNLNSDF